MKLREFLFKNISTKQTIAKNIFWLLAGQVGSRLIKAAIVIYAARILGAEGYGVFSLGLNIAALFMIFSDVGVSSVLTREVAKDTLERAKLISTSLALKSILLTISFIAIIFLAPYFTKIPEVRPLLPLFGLILMLDGLNGFGTAIVRALERMELEAATVIA
ncbi:MAG: oligosaccharide flippase family protein, partial [Candidatus Paceibacteria bacterium]